MPRLLHPDPEPAESQKPCNTRRPQKPGTDIRTKVILPLALCFLVLFTGAYFALRFYQQEHVESDTEARIGTVNQMFREELEGDAELMQAQLDFLVAARWNQMTLTLKYAAYDADALHTDTDKFWMSMDYAF